MYWPRKKSMQPTSLSSKTGFVENMYVKRRPAGERGVRFSLLFYICCSADSNLTGWRFNQSFNRWFIPKWHSDFWFSAARQLFLNYIAHHQIIMTPSLGWSHAGLFIVGYGWRRESSSVCSRQAGRQAGNYLSQLKSEEGTQQRVRKWWVI